MKWQKVWKMFISISQSLMSLLQVASSAQTTAKNRLLIYFIEWHRNAANPPIQEAKAAIVVTFLFEKWQLSEQLVNNFLLND